MQVEKCGKFYLEEFRVKSFILVNLSYSELSMTLYLHLLNKVNLYK